VPISYTGSLCARRGCSRPEWKDALCGRCWRLAKLFGRDPLLFAYEPVHGWDGDTDAVALPWEKLEREAAARGLDIADLLGRRPPGEATGT
jgi:hypothetical protein